MAGNVIPFGPVSDRARREFLAPLVDALSADPDLDVEPVPIEVDGARISGLRIASGSAGGAIAVAPMTVQWPLVGEQPIGLDQMATLAAGASLRPAAEPLAEGGRAAYRLTLPEGDQVRILLTRSPEDVVAAVAAWRSLQGRPFPPIAEPPDLDRIRARIRYRTELAVLDPRKLLEEIDSERLDAARAVLTDPARDALLADLRELDPRELLANLPLDGQGRWELGETALLASFEGRLPPRKDKQWWLTATTPARRRDPQVVRLGLEELTGENHTHRWDGARWRWDRRAIAGRIERWGADPAVDARAAEAIRLQDEGRLVEALALYDVELAPEAARLIDGGPFRLAERETAEAWARAAQSIVRGCAPWRLGPVLEAAMDAREARKPKKWTPPILRLAWLPHQTQQSKAALMLEPRSRKDRRPRIAIGWSASNARLPAVAWRRDEEIDAERFGLRPEPGPR